MPLLAGRTAEDQLHNAVEASAAAHAEVKRLGWADALDNDPRPSVVIDLNLVDIQRGTWGRVYSNDAYQHLKPTEHALRFHSKGGTYVFNGSVTFRDWAFGPVQSAPDPAPIVMENGMFITRVTMRGRWRLLQAIKQGSVAQLSPDAVASTAPIQIPTPLNGLATPQTGLDAKSPLSSGSVGMSRSVSGARSPRVNPVEDIQRHPMLRSADWSKSSIGAPETWPRWMQQFTGTILSDPDPNIIVWKDRTVVYNDAVIPLISAKHPAALGSDAAVAFEELWVFLEPIIETVRKTLRCKRIEAMALPMERRGYLEETHWTFTILPLFDEHGECVGIVDRFSEVTPSVVAGRRLNQLNLIAEKTGEAKSLDQLWDKVIDVMVANPLDSPFALLYAVEDSKGKIPTLSTNAESTRGIRCKFKSGLGLDSTQPALAQFEIDDPNNYLANICRNALLDDKITLLRTSDDNLPEQLQIVIPDRGYGDAINAVLVCPIKIGADKAIAVLIKALNPRRPIDSDYMAFAKLMSRRINDSFGRIFLPTEERQFRAEVEQAALEQAGMHQQLLMRARQAEDEAFAFTKLAENAPIGMYMYGPQGFPVYINDYFFRMTGLERERFEQFTWLDAVHPDDRDSSMKYWHTLYDKKEAVTFEFRMTKPYITTAQDGTEVAAESWALASAFPQLDENGEVVNIIGWQIDVSPTKWADALQKERLKDALESRAQAHRFIDMVSHECRNPLSAILQSADGILTSLGSFGDGVVAQQDSLQDTIETVQDSAQTIVLCAQHQKRIVDDILTVSKLDGNHLIITPDRADPIALVQHVLKMYETEMYSDSIKSDIVVLPSYKNLGINYVLLDPSRTLQVLINLVTNAIKFTARSKKRTITISVDATRKRPSNGLDETTFVPQRTARLSPTASHPEWATGRDLYIQFAVHDTGRGMSAEEIDKLFERFAQASPRTHIKYGGSGLGLFISRQLTELQGGQIGVSSKLGSGSTFAFYILARTSADPARAALTPVYTPGPASNGSESNRSSYPFPQVSGQTQNPPDQGTLAASAPAAAATSAAPRPSIAEQDLHVLIVEDNLINQKVMAKQLQKLGCTVHVANHGIEALEFLKRSVFAVLPPRVRVRGDGDGDGDGGFNKLDVILMDIEMPVMDGMACVREIRGMERRGELNGHVPVIAVTANAREAQERDAVKEGMDQVVTKPFRIPELVPKMMDLVVHVKGAGATAPAAVVMR